MSSNSVPQKKDEILKDGLSRIQQQMEFMFGELMTKIEKIKNRSDGDVVKRVEKLGRRRVLLETLHIKSRMIFTVVVGSVHIGEKYENRPRRGHIQPYRDFEY